MVKAPPVPSSLTDTFLVFGGAALDFLLLPVELSGTSSTGALHSEEVRLPEWVREVLPVFFPVRSGRLGEGSTPSDVVGQSSGGAQGKWEVEAVY